jgi:hypothetical protein
MKTSSAHAHVRFSVARAPVLITDSKLVRWIVSFVLLLSIGRAFGQPLNISASSAQYTTYVEGQGFPTNTFPPTSRTTVSLSPFRDELDFPIIMPPPLNGTNHSIANAALFEVSVQTGFGDANASATSQLWFSPLVDQTQAIGIQITTLNETVFTAGSLSLLDLTSNSELWNYHWDMGLQANGNVPWNSGAWPPNTANFNVDTDFLASHQYELTMMATSQAANDTEFVDIQLSGLQVVPEPSSFRLLLFALLGFGGCRFPGAWWAAKAGISRTFFRLGLRNRFVRSVFCDFS